MEELKAEAIKVEELRQQLAAQEKKVAEYVIHHYHDNDNDRYDIM
jgi:DNA-binding MurR/RpiR family transcriptional regulator